MSNQDLKTAFYYQLKLGKKALKLHNFEASFYHLENAHILGQKHLIRHTISHYWMLIYAMKSKKSKEIIGQVIRIIASLLFTLIWVPKGNTGGTNVSPIKKMPIRKELKKYFKFNASF
ncbi:DUF3703 domain-containing protein [Polaribacter ponticola]|uniref:DUF3703 domain-containing protein n=1 Tax=Polaribacter ponticola TaxID=2978475 RepID=A0ABT5S5Q7_9FLAO|nr:DUF3703 domain-containing protein [Polaribacter sp. MSW5]MDD7913438.1 DUF3703 domain-containing protein [Polaribacter sp. MSW5]